MPSSIHSKTSRPRRLRNERRRFALLESLEARDLLSAVNLSEQELVQSPVDLRVSEDPNTSNLDEFWVTLDSAPTHDVTITFTSSDPTDILLGDDIFDTSLEPTFELTFTPGNYSVAQNVVIRGENDLDVEGTHVVSITWAAASTDSSYDVLSGSLDAKIFDNDTDEDRLAINEFVNNHEGSDTDEFVELINLNDSTLGPTFATFHLLQVDGDGADQGTIDSITVINPGIPAGARETFDFNNQIEDGSMTWILVEGLDPDVTVGYDLDANNDGILDVPVPYTTIGGLPQDAVAVDDGDVGDAHYARIVLDPDYDAPQPGSGNVVGGASRLPDGFVATYGGSLLNPAAVDDRFGWDPSTAGSINGTWDVWTVALGPPGNLPDVSSFGSGANTTVTQNTPGAFITSTQNIYSFSSIPDYDVVIDTSDLVGSFTRVVVQWRTLGRELDYDSVLLDGVAPDYAEQLNKSVLGGMGGAGVDYLAVWDLPAPLSSYDLDFTAGGTSMSLDQFQVDAFAQATAFPEPAPFNPYVRNNPFGLPSPGTDVVPGLAVNTNDLTNERIPGLLILESDGSTDVTEGALEVDSYEVFIGSNPTANVTVNITADAQVEVAVDTDEDGDFADETFGSVDSIVFDTTSGGTSRTVFVRAVDDATVEANPHSGTITLAATSADSDYNGAAAFPKLLDNDFGTAGNTVTVSVGDNDVANAIVTDRRVFYNNSAFGTTSPTSKFAYQAGDGPITSISMTSYSRGLNGIAVEIADASGPLSVSDFSFAMSDQGSGANNVNAPSTWAAAPAPIGFTIVPDTPVPGTDRVEFIWADNAIENRYLEVTTLANANTGLVADDVFYFGNIIGDTFNDSSPAVWVTTAVDEVQIQTEVISTATIDSLLDMDRNGVHLASDRIVTRTNTIFALNKMADPLTPPAAPSGDGAGSAVASALAASAWDVGVDEDTSAAPLAAPAPLSVSSLAADPVSSVGSNYAAGVDEVMSSLANEDSEEEDGELAGLDLLLA